MKPMPTQELPADSEYIYVLETDEWKVQKKSGSRKLSKSNYGREAICGICGEWKPTKYSPAELQEIDWACEDCLSRHPEEVQELERKEMEEAIPPKPAPEERGSKEITTLDPEYKWLMRLVNTVVEAGVPASEIKALAQSNPFTTIDDAGDLAAKIWTFATTKYNIPREWLIKKLPEKKGSLKQAYEDGYSTENDATYWGTAAPGTYAYQPNINHDEPIGIREGETGEPITICPKCKSSDLTKEGEKATCNACGTDFVPKPDRGSDDPTVNDYSQNYFWGPNDLGRSHQNQPGANGWLPAGYEDAEGPSPNVMMSSFNSFMQKHSSLNKKASVDHKAWIAPDGKEFWFSPTSMHEDWIERNLNIISKYDPEITDFMYNDTFYELLKDGWTRVHEGTSRDQFILQVQDNKNPPDYCNDFIAKYFDPNDPRPIRISDANEDYSQVIADPFPTLQKALQKSKLVQIGALNKSAITKNYALYIGNVLMTRTMTRWKAEKILKERFPDAYASGNYSILEEEYKTGSLGKFSSKPKQIGKTYYFEYHCYEGEDSCDAELWHHTHQPVVILRQLKDIEEVDEAEVGRMYRVRFNDGFEYDVNEDELVNSPKEYYRPDYRKMGKTAHCGPCSVIKAEVLKMLADLKYKDGSVSDDILCEMAKLSAKESNEQFSNKLKEVFESLPKEHEAEANKLKNHYLALIDIQEKLDKGEMKADKPLSKKEAAKEVPTLSNKVITDLIPMFVDKTEPSDHKCKSCKFRIEQESKAICAIMKGEINLEKGTCNYWAEGEASKEQNPSQMERKTAGYVEANAINCGTCKHFKDNYCSLWNGKVKAEQCCMAWEGETIKEGSLDKKANPPSRFWIAPDGKEFEVPSAGHGVWIQQNEKVLKGYNIHHDNLQAMWDNMIYSGWTRVSNEPAGTGFIITVVDLKKLPKYLDNFIAKYYNNGEKIQIASDDRKSYVVVDDPFPSIQKAVNKALAQSKQASLLDEVLDQTTQDSIASEYGPSMLIALRFYNDAVRYGQSPDRAMAYALEEVKRMHRPLEQRKFLEVLNTYF